VITQTGVYNNAIQNKGVLSGQDFIIGVGLSIISEIT